MYVYGIWTMMIKLMISDDDDDYYLMMMKLIIIVMNMSYGTMVYSINLYT